MCPFEFGLEMTFSIGPEKVKGGPKARNSMNGACLFALLMLHAGARGEMKGVSHK